MWRTTLGVIEIESQGFLQERKRGQKSHRFRPFTCVTGIRQKQCSIRLRKLLIDFSSDHSFAQAAEKMREHHGVNVPISSIRHLTLQVAKKAQRYLPPKREENASLMIAEMDGCMIPTVCFAEAKDRRKTRKVAWEEMRIGVCQKHGEVKWGYASSFKSPDHLGNRLKQTMEIFGFTEETYVHGVGDGAFWIKEQGERIAGPNFHYLIDISHLSGYFFKAFEGLRLDPQEEMLNLKHMALKGQIDQVLVYLKEQQGLFPFHQGLLNCIRYIENRPGQFDYLGAKAKELPRGSGKVESTHRFLIQKRLKIAGAWWLKKNAAAIADLRTLRANGGWSLIWNEKLTKNKFLSQYNF